MGVAKPLRPQPLAPYLTGIVAKGMRYCGEGHGRGETSSPLALGAVPYWYCGEGHGYGKRLQRLEWLRSPPAWRQLIFAPSPWRRTLLIMWRRTWVWRKAPEARVAS
uniref:Uncharacterized protein n=1 Tax=Oryza punctata TaxID=4537 RepID=A0A0E0LZI4_ORYPU